MSFRVQLANTPKLIDAVFKLRHSVFVEEENDLAAASDGRLIDHFDALPDNNNLVAIADGEVVGAIRLALDCEIGLPADAYFDFRRHVPPDSRLFHTGMFCVSRSHRDARIPANLLKVAAYYAIVNEATHVLAPINPRILPTLARLGFKRVGADFAERHTGSVMSPLVLELRLMHGHFMRFVERNRIFDFFGCYDRLFAKRGEVIASAGSVDQDVYLVVEGEAGMRVPGCNQAFSTCGAGELIGDMNLLGAEPRSLDVVAESDLQVAAVPKRLFIERLTSDPERFLHFLHLLDQRTRELAGRLGTQIRQPTPAFSYALRPPLGAPPATVSLQHA